MSSVTRDQLLAIMPRAAGVVATFQPVLDVAMSDGGMVAPLRAAAFLANVAAETGQLSTVSENLNYSADGLANTWPSRFAKCGPDGAYLRTADVRFVPNALALELHHQPEKIANIVYANRMGNGDAASGDGWRYRGAGMLQLTGKAMHLAAAAHFGVDAALIGDWLRSPSGAARSAAWYFATRGCNTYADNGDFDGVCDMINVGRKTAKIGDSIGYGDRLAFYAIARTVFHC
jgi:putative chitinase